MLVVFKPGLNRRGVGWGRGLCVLTLPVVFKPGLNRHGVGWGRKSCWPCAGDVQVASGCPQQAVDSKAAAGCRSPGGRLRRLDRQHFRHDRISHRCQGADGRTCESAHSNGWVRMPRYADVCELLPHQQTHRSEFSFQCYGQLIAVVNAYPALDGGMSSGISRISCSRVHISRIGKLCQSH